jgi:hypothetical protein
MVSATALMTQRGKMIAFMFGLILFGFAGCSWLMSTPTGWWPADHPQSTSPD